MRRGPVAPGLPRSRASRMYLGRWMRSTDWYPDFQLRLYDRRVGALERAPGARVGRSERQGERRQDPAAPARRAASTTPIATCRTTWRRSIATRRSRRSNGRPRAGADRRSRAWSIRRWRSCGTTSCAAASATAPTGLLVSALNSYYVFLKLAKLLELQQRRRAAPTPRGAATDRGRPVTPHVLPPHRHGADLAGRAEPGARHRAWACGRSGHRAVLVAHPSGELRQRATEGLDLIPLAPRTEMDLGAAWRLSRLIKQLKPGHRPRPRSARRGDGGAGAVDEHAAGEAAADRGAPRRFPPARQLAVALEVPAGRLLHLRLGGDPRRC